jgi:hypothetical protein
MPDTIKRKPEDQTQLFEQVCKIERDVIERRRHFIKRISMGERGWGRQSQASLFPVAA